MSVLDQLNRAQNYEDRIPFIRAGIHILVVKEYKEVNSTKNGKGAGATLVVDSSTNPAHAPGSVVFSGWYPNHPPRYTGDTGQKDLDQLVDFVKKLCGDTDLETGKRKVGYALSPQGTAEQPLRGIRIKCTATEKPKAKKNADGTVGTWTELMWETIPDQTPDMIKSYRARVERVVDPGAIAPAPAATAPNPFGAAPAQPTAPPPAPAAMANPFGGGAPAQPTTPANYSAPPANPFGAPPPTNTGGTGGQW